uniref:BolA-like protein 1 n=1 Tax=Sphaeramia orbicularis TaxID=375764 RepID=A0A673A906_9TELE
ISAVPFLTKLTTSLNPHHLEVHNESHMHAVPPGSESHFRVLVVSAHFQGLSLLQRHRLVNEALKEELSSCVHALAIQAKTPEQWDQNPTLAKTGFEIKCKPVFILGQT